MGGSWFQYEFNHHDWRVAVRDLQVQARDHYGHREGYSGDINSCSNFTFHHPRVEIKTRKQLEAYIDSRVQHISTRDGEVIDLGITGYSIAKPVVKEAHGIPIIIPDLRKIGEPAVLLGYFGNIVARGSLMEIKERGRRLVMKERFENDYYIVGKNTTKKYVVTGEGTVVKKTTKTSDADQLVLPLHDFIVYGWAAE